MTCKDCLHYEACKGTYYTAKGCDNIALYDFDGEMYADSGCEDFADRSEWVHLLCKVGDEIFLLLETMYGNYKIVKSKCVKIIDYGNEIDYSMYVNCPEIDNSIEFNACDFGNVVFLNIEEAKKALEGKK